MEKLQYLADEGFLQKAEQVWNLDKTAFNTSETFNRIVARKGTKQIWSQFDGSEKEVSTIRPAGNAAGLQLKCTALYAGKRHVRSRLDGTKSMCYHSANPSGYMDAKLFAEYVKEVLFPAMTEDK
ncbi:hypothetical protein RvY_19407, partial [Ramazzottius varieornatus]